MDLLFLYGGIMVACYWVASRQRNRAAKFAFMDPVLNAVVFALVFIMGLRMGANEEVTSQLGTIGFEAVGITVFTVGGSIAAVSILRRIIGLDKYSHPKKEHMGDDCADIEISRDTEDIDDGGTAEGDSGVKMTLGILFFVVLGMILGYFLVPELVTDLAKFQSVSGDMIVVGLCIILGIIGFNMGLSGEIIQSLKAAGFKIFLFPLFAISGSILAGALYSIISPLTVREAMAVSAGFGWYTFAPSVISDAGHAVAGAVSFVHNILRETLGIISIPLAAKVFGFIEATSITGVASMDVCLPIVKKACNEETVIYSFVIGVCMNIAVPLLVPLIIG
ncbi:MAG: lysine exporter LysO family protein [Firmicutes bacterium]|nr:lysine exporter LysO family protein [Bacillota bacterium]